MPTLRLGHHDTGTVPSRSALLRVHHDWTSSRRGFRDEATDRWRALEAVAGTSVASLQEGLRRAGFLPHGPVDGVFGYRTSAREFGDSPTFDADVAAATEVADALERLGVHTRVLSAIAMQELCEPYIRRRAMRHLEKRRVVIFAAGTGNPFFTTDTAAALRASEMGCDALLKGTQVDGVYSEDPKVNAKAERFDRLTYLDVLARDLNVMDASAVSLARENNIPIIVFSIHNAGGFQAVVCGEGAYTIVANETG